VDAWTHGRSRWTEFEQRRRAIVRAFPPGVNPEFDREFLAALEAGRALTAGAGEEVVFLHGTSGHLEAFVRTLPAHAARYSCHAIDMLGHGYTGSPTTPTRSPATSSTLLAYLDGAGIGRAHLVGESLGGWVAAWLASEHPERVATLQLVAAGGTKADPAIMERIRRSTEEAVRTDDVGLTRKRLELLMHDPANVTDELVAVRHAIYHQPEFVANPHNLLCLQDMETRQRNLLRPGPARHHHRPDPGGVGPAEPVRRGARRPTRWPEAVPGARLELLDECGHWPQHEQVRELHRAEPGVPRRPPGP
jgi:2-hydroxy-6-oxonona-2,4-dienedioate hydrolase